MAAVASKNGVTRHCLYQVFRRTYPRMEKIIANTLGLHPQQIWPDRYDEYGRPVGRMGRRKKVYSHGDNKSIGKVASFNIDEGDSM